MKIDGVPEAYIERCFKRPPVKDYTEEVLRDVLLRTLQPIGEVNYCNSDEIIAENDSVSAKINYQESSFGPMYDEYDLLDGESWNLLRGITLQNKESGAIFDLKEVNLLHEGGYKIFFPSQGEPLFSTASGMDQQHKEIIVDRPPVSFAGLAILFHEIGHVVDNANRGIVTRELGRMDKRFRKGYPSGIHNVLRSERNAWAFALKTMRPFLSKEPGSCLNYDQIDILAYRLSLRSYAADALKRHKKRERKLAKKAMAHSELRRRRRRD